MTIQTNPCSVATTWVIWVNTWHVTEPTSGGPILTISTPYDVFLRKDMLSWALINIASNFGGRIPQNTTFCGVNRHFQSLCAKILKREYYQNYWPILTKFCTVTRTSKYSLWVVQTRKINSRWRTVAILKYRKSAIYPQLLYRSVWNLADWRILTLQTVPVGKISTF